jgi:hypothetical protein
MSKTVDADNLKKELRSTITSLDEKPKERKYIGDGISTH